MKRIIPPIFLIFLILFILSGCENSLEPGKTTVVFSHGVLTSKVSKVMDNIIKKFEEKNKDIKIIRHEVVSNTDVQRRFYLLTFKSESLFIDIFELDMIWIGELAAANLIYPIKDLNNNIEKKYLSSFIKSAIYDKKIYALPLFCSAGVIFYRKDLLKKYGFNTPKTWKELENQALTISKKENIDGFIFQGKKYEGLVCFFLEIYRSMGGKILTNNKERKVELNKNILKNTLTFFRNLIKKNISPYSVLHMTEKESLEHFKNGKAVFLRGWNDFDKLLPDKNKFGIMSLPKFNNNPSIPTLGGWLLGINIRSKHKKEALKFIHFMTNEDTQKYFAEKLGRYPVLTSLYNEKDKKLNLPNVSFHKKVLLQAKPRPISPYYHYFSIICQNEIYSALKSEININKIAQRLIKKASSIKLLKKATPEFPRQLLLPSTVY